MTGFEPLRETSASAFERALLRSADGDEPAPRALAKTAAALGVGATVLGAAGNTAAAVGTAGAVTTFWVTLVKPLLIGAMGGLVVAVSAHQLGRPSEAPKPAPVALQPPGVLPSSPVAPRVAQRVEESAPPLPLPAAPPAADAPAATLETKRSTSEPRAKPGPRAEPAFHAVPEASAEAPKNAPAPPAPAAASASIASEIVTIDRARQALRDGRPSDALHELDVYRVAWPSGVLATEAAVLRIESHLALGDRTSGVRAARAFLSANPSGRYAARVRALFNAGELE